MPTGDIQVVNPIHKQLAFVCVQSFPLKRAANEPTQGRSVDLFTLRRTWSLQSHPHNLKANPETGKIAKTTGVPAAGWLIQILQNNQALAA